MVFRSFLYMPSTYWQEAAMELFVMEFWTQETVTLAENITQFYAETLNSPTFRPFLNCQCAIKLNMNYAVLVNNSKARLFFFRSFSPVLLFARVIYNVKQFTALTWNFWGLLKKQTLFSFISVTIYKLFIFIMMG